MGAALTKYLPNIFRLKTSNFTDTSRLAEQVGYDTSTQKVTKFDRKIPSEKKRIQGDELLQHDELTQDVDYDAEEVRYDKDSMKHIIRTLGLKKRFLEDFDALPSVIRHHRNSEDWIFIFLERYYNSIKEDSVRLLLLNEDLLDKMGFESDSKVAEAILKRSKLLIPSHDDTIDVVRRFLEDELKYNRDLSDGYHSPDLPSVCSHVYAYVAADKGKILVDSEGEKLVMKNALRKDLSGENKVLFHGTDIQSAYDIASGGIAITMGSHKRDFSNGKGFYLTNDFICAKKWAFSITQKPVVLIFSIPKTCLDLAKKLDLSRKSQRQGEWNEIVSANRSGSLNWKMRKDLEKYDCIEGPISIASNGEREVIRQPSRFSSQLCIIKEEFADKISGFLETVVVYDIILM